jgi:hypothetical protein
MAPPASTGGPAPQMSQPASPKAEGRELSARRAALASRQAERDVAAVPAAAGKVSWAPTPPPAARRTRSGGDGSVSAGGDAPAAVLSAKRPAPDTAASCGTPTLGATTPAAAAAAAVAAAAAAAKRPRPAPTTASAASDDAVTLGYELGTIKHSAYVLLQRAGASGLTVSTIVETATREGLYSWGTCKTPNNSVTAALSQDANFQRVAPSTYALRDVLRPVGQAALREAAAARSAAAAAAASGGGGSSDGGAPPLPPKPRASGSRPPKRPGGGGRAGGGNDTSTSRGDAPSRSHNSDAAAGDRGAHRSGEVHSRASGAAAAGGGGGGRATRGSDAADCGCGAEACGGRDAPGAGATALEREATSFAFSAAIYPPPSPPTPEEERALPGGAASLASRDAYGGLGVGLNLWPSPVAAPPPTEAHARAVRWRHEAAEARPLSAAAVAAAAAAAAAADAAAAANSLPSWVVQAYLADKAEAREADGDDASANGAPLPLPAAATVCAC